MRRHCLDGNEKEDEERKADSNDGESQGTSEEMQ